MTDTTEAKLTKLAVLAAFCKELIRQGQDPAARLGLSREALHELERKNLPRLPASAYRDLAINDVVNELNWRLQQALERALNDQAAEAVSNGHEPTAEDDERGLAPVATMIANAVSS